MNNVIFCSPSSAPALYGHALLGPLVEGRYCLRPTPWDKQKLLMPPARSLRGKSPCPGSLLVWRDWSFVNIESVATLMFHVCFMILKPSFSFPWDLWQWVKRVTLSLCSTAWSKITINSPREIHISVVTVEWLTCNTQSINKFTLEPHLYLLLELSLYTGNSVVTSAVRKRAFSGWISVSSSTQAKVTLMLAITASSETVSGRREQWGWQYNCSVIMRLLKKTPRSQS